MSKYVRGVKRNQIIQRWLQGIEDPEYEVFPTKKEGKYIVKLRETKLVDQTNVESDKQSIDIESDKQSVDNDVSETESTPPPVIKQRRPRTDSISMQRNTKGDGNFAPQTINLEILEQLRNLGEEIRNDRFKKEQKQFIKQIVNKEINKSRIRSKYVPDIFPVCEADIVKQQENESANAEYKVSTENKPVEAPLKKEEEPIYQEPETPKFRSRIRR